MVDGAGASGATAPFELVPAAAAPWSGPRSVRRVGCGEAGPGAEAEALTMNRVVHAGHA